MKRIAILGSTGMLGSMVLKYLASLKKYNIYTFSRRRNLVTYPEVVPNFIEEISREDIGEFDYLINCIGITKPHLKNETPEEIFEAVSVNVIAPIRLSRLKNVNHIIQIATDCVYSSQSILKTSYDENAPHDPTDAYGKTKSLGEIKSDKFTHLRSSIIGPEEAAGKFLLEWFLRQPQNAKVDGYSNHFWNGVTTLQFAKACEKVIDNDYRFGKQHIVPSGIVSKYELLVLMQEVFNRQDIIINKIQAKEMINRVLSTINEENNLKLWEGKPLNIHEMLIELRDFAKT